MNTFPCYAGCVAILCRLVTERGLKQATINLVRAHMRANTLIMLHQMAESSVYRTDVNVGGRDDIDSSLHTYCIDTGRSPGFPGGLKGKIQLNQRILAKTVARAYNEGSRAMRKRYTSTSNMYSYALMHINLSTYLC